ncbi:MAG: hypothetical protein ACI4TX_02370, partial [Christensenellales bacterium]
MKLNKKEIIKNIIIGIIFAFIIIAFVVAYVNYRASDVKSKVIVNVVPPSYTVNASNSVDFVSAVDYASKCVVEINATLNGGVSAGSGVIYAGDESVTYVITNFHVIEGATQFKLILYDGTTINDVQLVGGDDKQDI